MCNQVANFLAVHRSRREIKMWHEVFNISRRTRRIKEINQAKISADFVAASKDQITKPDSSQMRRDSKQHTGDIKSVDAAVFYITTSCIADCCYPTLRHGKQGKFLWWRGLSDLFTDQSPIFPLTLVETPNIHKTDDERTTASSVHHPSIPTRSLMNINLFPIYSFLLYFFKTRHTRLVVFVFLWTFLYVSSSFIILPNLISIHLPRKEFPLRAMM